jgi:hypothetical protein
MTIKIDQMQNRVYSTPVYNDNDQDPLEVLAFAIEKGGNEEITSEDQVYFFELVSKCVRIDINATKEILRWNEHIHQEHLTIIAYCIIIIDIIEHQGRGCEPRVYTPHTANQWKIPGNQWLITRHRVHLEVTYEEEVIEGPVKSGKQIRCRRRKPTAGIGLGALLIVGLAGVAAIVAIGKENEHH